jgi:hypothetical protein
MPEITTVSIGRLYLMRAMYFLNFALVCSGVFVEFLHRRAPWDQITGAAFSLWGSLALLSALGLRYPLAMLPLLFFQLCYKIIWFLMVYIPLRTSGRTPDLAIGFAIAIVLDFVVIPWRYAVQCYLARQGDRWH